MKCFQLLNDEILIIKEDKMYKDTADNFITDGGSLQAGEVTLSEVIYDDQQSHAVVNGDFCDKPIKAIEDKIAAIDVYISAKAAREYVPPTFDELKISKLNTVKMHRDTAEIAPIEHGGNAYDFDTKSRDRLDIALKALSVQGEEATINWTMADNTTATITVSDIMGVFVASAVRSNALHEQYRSIKEKIEAAQSVEELNAIEVGGAE